MVLPPSRTQEPPSNHAQCLVWTRSGVVLSHCGHGAEWLDPQKAERFGQEKDRGFKQKIWEFTFVNCSAAQKHDQEPQK